MFFILLWGKKKKRARNSNETKESQKIRKNHFQRLSEETMMKLPHLRKHKEYIKTIDIGSGPRDYNAFREILDVNHNQKTKGKGSNDDSNNNSNSNSNNNNNNSNNNNNNNNNNNSNTNNNNTNNNNTTHSTNTNNNNNNNNNNTAHSNNSNNNNNNSNNNNNNNSNSNNSTNNNNDNDFSDNYNDNENSLVHEDEMDHVHGDMTSNDMNTLRRRTKKKGYSQEKSDLYKTELCENWVSKGRCTYGRKCHFAHGFDDMKYRTRVANYKTQPCCDPARSDSRLCLFGKRCNYAHPGEPLRCVMSDEYVDEEYFDKVKREFKEILPFGIYV
ncbi:hypothetical protein RFI_02221 [Reticulomyxa filosa]|uniref:C3H1-type domain-containing protein n=1 Tax=Reticulomyxa filosa TaxID=46433 RepID=X6P9P0_RETFI|nr:hypothetical protein RFI_02221 [Reticulomyxa filosa]|eukprot:ETO34866.1 hypothetical protein RFI_02221 [Reticulomyxa filosa]